jgi:plastocyanin
MRCFMLVALLFTAACGGTDAVSTLPAGTVVIETKAGATATFTSLRGGSFIAWHSADGVHHSMASNATPAVFPEIDVPAGGISTDVKFAVPGDYGYFCTIHGAAAENGTIHVLVPASLILPQ